MGGFAARPPGSATAGEPGRLLQHRPSRRRDLVNRRDQRTDVPVPARPSLPRARWATSATTAAAAAAATAAAATASATTATAAATPPPSATTTTSATSATSAATATTTS